MEVDVQQKQINWDELETLAKTHSLANKYYYIPEDERSYKFNLLLRSAILACQQCVDNNHARDKYYLCLDLYSPKGAKIGWIFICDASELSSQQLLDKIVKEIEKETIVDQSRSNGDTICPLTCDSYDKPVILNLNGRTYSLHAIQQAISKTLIVDFNLRLEDMTITPSRLKEIILFPRNDLNETKVYGQSGKYTYKSVLVQYQPFNMERVVSKNIPEMNNVMANLDKTTENEIWDYELLWNSYANFHGLPKFTHNSELMEDLIFENLVIPPRHPKCSQGHITFKNILLNNCTVQVNCWCGMSMRSSKFKSCVIDCTQIDREAQISRCIFENCIFMLRGKQGTGSVQTFPMDQYSNDFLFQLFKHKLNFESNILDHCILKIYPPEAQ